LAEAQGDLDNAVRQFNDALWLQPNHSPSLFHLGRIYTELKQFPKAIDAWQRYIKATNGDATGYSNLGFCYEVAKRPTDAEAAYKQGIAKDPQNQPCRVNYGLMLAGRGDLTAAGAQLGVVLAPAEVHYDLGSVLESQGRTDAARAEYRKALQFDPKMGDAQQRLAALD
jgi:tetratricopeptide (TPR) repeat protein